MQRLRLGVSVLALLAAGCDDSFGPQVWDATPDTTTLYSVSRPELLGRPAGFDIIQLRPIVLESPNETGTWDFALAEQGGRFVLLPAGAVEGLDSRAGIATTTAATLEEVREAPAEADEFSQEAVPIEVGRIYIIRSRRDACGGFGTGVRYAKLMAVAVDAATGTFRFAVVRNPFCNDRSLIPPEED